MSQGSGQDSRAAPSSSSKHAGGKSKAALLREWRTERNRRPFSEALLLRDALYLLQGIDGRYIRFAIAPPPERNPYLTEKGKKGDGVGFPLGANGVVVSEVTQPEVVGIDIAADEAKVSFLFRRRVDLKDGFISQPTRSILVQLSELGVLYRQITSFIKEHQAAGPSSRSGMVVQVSTTTVLPANVTEPVPLPPPRAIRISPSPGRAGITDGAYCV